MNTPLLWLIILVFLAISGVFIYNSTKVEEQINRDLEIELRTINEEWVYRAIKNQALYIVGAEYREQGKPITTQKGQYRASFKNDVDRRFAQYCKDCLTGAKFSNDFCIFTRVNYPDARVKDLENIIQDFLLTRKKEIEENFETFIKNTNFITPGEFFVIKSRQNGDVVGVYIIHNETKDMYYVGQAKRLFFRINQHFTGHGNGDVYADYKYGDDFAIKIIKLSDSGYSDLDLLEKDMINKYKAYEFGYNRTIGNR